MNPLSTSKIAPKFGFLVLLVSQMAAPPNKSVTQLASPPNKFVTQMVAPPNKRVTQMASPPLKDLLYGGDTI